MPNYVYVTWALLGAVIITVILLAWTLSRVLKFLRERARKEEAEDHEFEAQVEKLGRHRRGESEPRRHLWLLPVLAVLAAMGGWARNHPGGIVAAAAAALGTAAMAVLVASGSTGHHAAEPPTPPAVVAPTSTAELPSPGLSSTTSPGGGATTRSVPLDPGTAQALLPPTTVPVSPPAVTTSTHTVDPPVPTSVTTVTRAPRCLLHLDALLDVCVSVR